MVPHIKMEETYDSLRWYDYLILAGALCISLFIGIYNAFAKGNEGTTKEYLLGGRKMNILPVALSSFATRFSGIAIMGFAAEFYEHGITLFLPCLTIFVVIIPTAYVMVPTLYDLGFTSTNEYLEARYNTKILRLTSAVFSVITMVMFIGLAMFAPAISLEAVAGVPFLATVLATAFLCTLYSALGGFRGVVRTDVFQGLVMYAGCIVVLIVGTQKVGGFSEVWKTSWDNGRFKIDMTLSPLVRASFWTVVAGSLSAITVPTSQGYYQRIVSMRSKTAAIWMLILTYGQSIIIYVVVYMCGMVVFTYYFKQGCDPLQSGQIQSANQILPFFIMDGLRIPGIPGVFTAVLFCAVLSSVSSTLNNLAAITWKDFLEPYLCSNATELRRTLLNKVVVVIYGAVGLGFTFMYSKMQGNFLMISSIVTSAFEGPIEGVYLIGLFCPWVEWKAALVGLLSGFSIQAAMSLGAALDYPWKETLPTNTENCTALGFNNTIADYGESGEMNPFFMVSVLLYPMVSTGTTMVMTLAISLFVRNNSPVDARLIIPVADRIFCCLPKAWRVKIMYRGSSGEGTWKTHDTEGKKPAIQDIDNGIFTKEGQADVAMTKF